MVHFTRLLPFILVSVACCANSPVRGDERDGEERLILKGGNELSGTSRGFREGNLRWEFSSGEEILVPLVSIERVEYAPPTWEEDPKGAVDADRFQTPADPEPESYGYLENVCRRFGSSCDYAIRGFARSTRRIEFGARFLDGNSDNDFLNLAGRFEKNTEQWISQFDFEGQLTQEEGNTTSNRWTGDFTLDYDGDQNERWILFATSKNEYDEFENLDYRGTYSAGLGYRAYNEPNRRMVFRLGPAATVEYFRDPDNTRTTPDAFGEVEINWPLRDRLQYELRSNVRPSLEDTEIFRVVSRHGLIMQLDERGRWSLKLGLRYEYNSKPNPGRLKADYTSSILVIYTRQKP